LDGGTFKKLEPWLRNRELPFLSSLYSEGCHANLRVFFPTLSPLEWACFYTGKSPGKLGLFALSHVEDLREPQRTWHVIDSTTVGSKSFWRILADNGIPAGVVNIPATYPPEEIQGGFMISGYLTPPGAKDFFYPKSIEQYLADGYKIESEFEYLPDKTIQTERLLEELREMVKCRTKAMIRIMSSIKVRLVVVNFKEIDTIQHIFWDDDQTLLGFMKFVDSSISALAAEFRPSHVLVMSDHGFHEAESEYFYLNTWLKQKGVLSGAGGPKGKFWTAAYRLAVSLSRRSRLIRRLVLSQKESAAKYAGLQIDLSASMIYASQWGVFFSPKMRARSDYEETRRMLRNELLSILSPSGFKVFDSVYFREELFQGEFLDRFPDLVPIPSPRFLINPNLDSKTFDTRFDRPYLKGAHKSDPNGVFILWGKGVRTRVDLGTLALTDIAPTVLFLFGFDPPCDMDGRIAEKAFSEDFLARKQSRHAVSVPKGETEKEKRVYSEQEQEQIMEQLRRLGYV
jgi:predicted AlkP superfamily phosphohydrolase/phosphomutase